MPVPARMPRSHFQSRSQSEIANAVSPTIPTITGPFNKMPIPIAAQHGKRHPKRWRGLPDGRGRKDTHAKKKSLRRHNGGQQQCIRGRHFGFGGKRDAQRQQRAGKQRRFARGKSARAPIGQQHGQKAADQRGQAIRPDLVVRADAQTRASWRLVPNRCRPACCSAAPC